MTRRKTASELKPGDVLTYGDGHRTVLSAETDANGTVHLVTDKHSCAYPSGCLFGVIEVPTTARKTAAEIEPGDVIWSMTRGECPVGYVYRATTADRIYLQFNDSVSVYTSSHVFDVVASNQTWRDRKPLL